MFSRERSSAVGKEEINAFLGSSTEYSGKLVFQGAVRIDGIFKGEIISEGSLIIGKDAQVEGTIEVGELMLAGLFTGKAQVKRKATIQRGGKLVGDLFTNVLAVEEGAVIHGGVSMSSEVANVTTTTE